MIIDKNSWHFKLYKFWKRRSVERKWDYDCFLMDVRDGKFSTNLCQYFNRVVTFNLLYLAFMVMTYGGSIYLTINALFYNFNTFISTTGVIVGVFVAFIALFLGIMALLVKIIEKVKGEPEERPNIFVERYKAYKGKYCPKVEVK